MENGGGVEVEEEAEILFMVEEGMDEVVREGGELMILLFVSLRIQCPLGFSFHSSCRLCLAGRSGGRGRGGGRGGRGRGGRIG